MRPFVDQSRVMDLARDLGDVQALLRTAVNADGIEEAQRITVTRTAMERLAALAQHAGKELVRGMEPAAIQQPEGAREMTKPTLSEPVALSDDICLTQHGVDQARQIASDLRDGSAVARLVAHALPGGYPDLQAALFLLERDLEHQATALDELVQPI